MPNAEDRSKRDRPRQLHKRLRVVGSEQRAAESAAAAASDSPGEETPPSSSRPRRQSRIAPHAVRQAHRARRTWFALVFFPFFAIYKVVDALRDVRDGLARARGVRALLSEGGPTLFHGWLATGLVDELFLTLTPLLTGDAAEIGILPGLRLDDPARFALSWALRSGDELFLRYATVR